MTVTLATRYLVADVEVGMREAKRAKAMWLKAGAKDFRCRQFFTGAFNGEWLFHIDFEDFAHLQKCREAVQKTKDTATIQANNAKAGNKQLAREVLLGVDI
jgi:hypothetical protein